MAARRPAASLLRAGFIVASAAWAVLLVAVPFVASHAHASAWAGAAIAAVYGIGAFVCHQLPERSMHLWSVQMPVCARCAGIYFGAVAGALVWGRSAKAFALRYARVILAMAAAPTAVTLAYEWTTGDMPSHAIRAAAGACIGAAVAWLVVAAADNQVN
jgi:uncharacterized membrane protein